MKEKPQSITTLDTIAALVCPIRLKNNGRKKEKIMSR
jgi:hypothetical protein